MTDYIKQLSSSRAWERDEATRLSASLRQEATIVNGVIRWQSNNRVPPSDCVALAVHVGLPVDVAACDTARDAEQRAAIADYKRRQAQRTPEEIAEQHAEARAAHGAGVRLVNVVTGETFVT